MLRKPPKEWLRRLDRIAADLNVMLALFAIGLAVLDVTFLLSQRLIDRLPELTRVTYVAHPAPPNVVAGQPNLP